MPTDLKSNEDRYKTCKHIEFIVVKILTLAIYFPDAAIQFPDADNLISGRFLFPDAGI